MSCHDGECKHDFLNDWAARELETRDAKIGQLQSANEDMSDKLNQIRAWCEAYPIPIFSEPDWHKVNEILGGPLLTQISASNMRHVVAGVNRIINKEEL